MLRIRRPANPCYPGLHVATASEGSRRFDRNYRYNDGAVYGQDTWKLTPRLTLNLGLRWEYYGVQHNANQALDSNFVFGPGATHLDQIRNGSG